MVNGQSAWERSVQPHSHDHYFGSITTGTHNQAIQWGNGEQIILLLQLSTIALDLSSKIIGNYCPPCLLCQKVHVSNFVCLQTQPR